METLPLTTTDLKKRNNHVSSFVKGGLGLLVTANVDLIVAFTTVYWATWSRSDTHEYGGHGLWMIWHCSMKTPSADDAELGSAADVAKGRPNTPLFFPYKYSDAECVEKMADLSFPGWYVVTQVLTTLSLAGLLSSVLLLLLYIFLHRCYRRRTIMSAIIGLGYLSGLSLVVALFVFGFKVAEEISERAATEWFLSWSFSLACTAFVLSQIAASILLTENKRLFVEEMERTTDDDEGRRTSTSSVTHQTIFVQPVEVKIINNKLQLHSTRALNI